MFCKYFSTTKTLYTTLPKVFLVFLFCFVKHKSVRIFDVHVMWFISIKYLQQIHWIFTFLIWNVDWKSQLVFITIPIHSNAVLFLNLAKIFFLHRKSNPIIIKIVNKLFVVLCNSFWMYFYGIIMPNMAPKKKCLIVIFDAD